MWKNILKLFIFICLLQSLIVLNTCKKLDKVMMVSTGTVSDTTNISAKVTGQIVDQGKGVTQYGHYYSITANETSSGLTTSGMSSGTNGGFYSQLTGLIPGTRYYIKAYVKHGTETKYGDEISFSTLTTTPPIAISTTATAVTNSTATLNGTVNANNLSTTVTFEYGLTTSYGTSVNATPSPVTGSTVTNVSASLTNLTAGTLYHYRINAVSNGGTVNGTDLTFTTNSLLSPIATTSVATSVMNTTATLNGTVNANNLSTTVTFEFGLTSSYGSTVNASPSPVTGSSTTSLSATLTGLTEGTSYHFRVKAVSSGGTSYGSDQIFTTLCLAPSIATIAASNLGTTIATLNGNVDANNSSTTVTFEYGTSVSYGNTVAATQSPVTGSSTNAVSAGVTDLSSNTQYHYRVIAVNCGGTAFGTDQTFTTLCLIATATSNNATALTNTTATFNGTVNPNGCSTVVTFEFGLTISYGSSVTASQSPVGGSNSTSVSALISGLSSGQTYHFRVKATSPGGINYGSDLPLSTTVKDYDGNDYNTVIIGTQVWMLENLKTTKYKDGTSIPVVTDSPTWSSISTGAYCWYNNDPVNYKDPYGALYNWYAVSSDKLCPIGWHVATDDEWTTLTTYLGGESIAGSKLKEVGTTHWLSPNTGTNESGFTAIPVGDRSATGNFEIPGLDGTWWSSTPYDINNAWFRVMTYNLSSVSRNFYDKPNGFSVRCIRN